jgi:CHAT domain-containing protein
MRFRVIVLIAIAVVLVPAELREPKKRIVGNGYAPRRAVFRGFDHDRRGEIAKTIPELRQAARNDDPVALTDLAAALISKQESAWSYGPLVSLNVDSRFLDSRVLEPIALLQRAIERRPGLAAAHFNLALALKKVGLPVEARAQFDEAIRLSDDLEWNEEARHLAERLGVFNPYVVQGYVAVTSHPSGRRLLRPYLEAQQRRLAHVRLPAYPDSRFLRAAQAYRNDADSVGTGLLWAMQGFCSDTTVEPCATRYLTAGALYVVGRKSEAAAWLHSIEAEVQRAHGSAGLRALQRWEEGLNLFVQGRLRLALYVFEVQYAEHWTSRERALAAVFDELRRTLRGYLASVPLLVRDPAAAFEFADHSSLRDVQNALAPDAAIVRYAPVINDRMVVFVVRRDVLDVVTLFHDQTRAGIESAGRMRATTDAASQLQDLVIAPVLEKLHGISTLAIIRNDELADIPFGALFDVNRGQYLAERFTIVHARSARAAVELSKRARDVHDTTLLAIGATQTEGEVLAGVDREIAAITAQSLCARVFSGKEATPDAIQRALTENAVIHYGGHIVRRGADLRLLLAPSRGRDGLSAQEIAHLRMDKARVVVLAGCRGAASGDSHVIIRTVADAFLLAGVPTVIATSYDLDDAEAPPTMRLLHTFLRNGEDAAVALRKTTLAELRSGRGVPLSVRFQAVGGTRELIH